ncbi:MAG: hypothetical protein IT376_21150 [Polyangiaceae bacterium]|nr:hypothetical protein [Polyangiaceae bacterium]
MPPGSRLTSSLRSAVVAVALLCAAVSASCGEADEGAPGDAAPDLRADVDRDGRVDTRGDSDEAGEAEWSATRGAVVLANLDDDERACPRLDAAGAPLSDLDLAACHDAADSVVNGPDDLADLTAIELLPWPGAPAGVELSVTWTRADVPTGARLFLLQGGAWTPLPSGALVPPEAARSGASLRLEATEVPRGVSGEGAFVDVTVAAAAGSRAWSDTVRLRVAPVVTQHDRTPARQVLSSRVEGLAGYLDFHDDLVRGVAESGTGVEVTPWPPPALDPWIQDLFELGWMTRPIDGGTHAILVALRSANVTRAVLPSQVTPESPRREAGRMVFDFRGPDTAVVQVFDPTHPVALDTFNSTGNFDRVPPHEAPGGSYPLGRAVRGATPTAYPDRAFTALLDAQEEAPPLELDTSWLRVGHVDEMLAFVPAASARGWAVLIASPRRARAVFEELAGRGLGETPVFAGKLAGASGVTPSAETTVAAVLADEDVMAASLRAAIELDEIASRLTAELGLAPSELVEAPVLFAESLGRAVAYTPSLVNGVSLPPAHLLVPRAHGPRVDGVDVLEASLADGVAALGLTLVPVEDWELFHVNGGEVHCATNLLRGPGTAPWWGGPP